ncbi:MAG: hypothetical protein K2I42_03045 [Anaeroplasmataceae bacterium]|nr:hypothetical protein [Anaeroplasmataceae bacterium]
MRKWFRFIVLIFLLCSLSSCDNHPNPIDEIEEYTIFVSPTEEGNLLMRYKIIWHVLDSDKEGPLEWVRIGIPNQYIKSLSSHSSSIDVISFSSNNGDVVRIDLDRAYYADERVTMEFSFIQTHIYTLKDDKVQYRFIPGWFDQIQVKNLTVLWKKDQVIYHNSMSSDEEYLIWNASLDFGESIQVDVKYDSSSFINLSKSNTYPKDNSKWIILAIAGFFLFIMTFIVVMNRICNDGYYDYRGFSGRSFYHRHWWLHSRGVNHHGDKISDPRIVNRGSSHSSGSSCACACACACAGGGRAGCSRKDFYQQDQEIEKIISKLKK